MGCTQALGAVFKSDVWSAAHVGALAMVRLRTTEAGLALAGLLRHSSAMLRLARRSPNRTTLKTSGRHQSNSRAEANAAANCGDSTTWLNCIFWLANAVGAQLHASGIQVVDDDHDAPELAV